MIAMCHSCKLCVVPRGPRGTCGGGAEGYACVGRTQQEELGWREKDELMGLSGTLNFLKLNFPQLLLRA